MAEQKITVIEVGELLDETAKFFCSDWRLVQISCTFTDPGFELSYSFDKEYALFSLRLVLDSAEKEIPSVSNIYFAAFLYENEIKDLFGLKFKQMALDYKGSFYKTAVKFPFTFKSKEADK